MYWLILLVLLCLGLDKRGIRKGGLISLLQKVSAVFFSR